MVTPRRFVPPNTKQVPPETGGTGTSLDIASGGTLGRHDVSLATPQRGVLPPRLRPGFLFSMNKSEIAKPSVPSDVLFLHEITFY